MAGDATAPTTEKDEYQALCEKVNEIAQPLANRKLAKKLYKLIKKASIGGKTIREGIKDVQKELRRNEKGICILAGNVSPIDVYSHIPAICEEKEIPYVYIPSREQLGLAVGHRRPSILIYVKPSADYQELYDEIAETLHHLTVDAA
uniref:H/ACA ribonucleoprotein complex subunit 2 n=1 Tax=Caenorhabditis japonica TaxID=281687 RepID=A0A8R1IUZ5_CAEJA